MVGERAEAEKAAGRIQEQYWDGTVPVDPARIATDMGIRVVDARLDADVDGAVEKKRGKPATIYLSVRSAPNRKRFTCAHELAHSVKHSADGDFEYIDYRDGISSTGQVSDERLANAFAAALLMPAKSVRRLKGEGASEHAMARLLGVSEEAMVNRLKTPKLYR